MNILTENFEIDFDQTEDTVTEWLSSFIATNNIFNYDQSIKNIEQPNNWKHKNVNILFNGNIHNKEFFLSGNTMPYPYVKSSISTLNTWHGKIHANNNKTSLIIRSRPPIKLFIYALIPLPFVYITSLSGHGYITASIMCLIYSLIAFYVINTLFKNKNKIMKSWFINKGNEYFANKSFERDAG